METYNLKPGDLLVTTFGVYQHWSIVSDRLDDQQRPFLISASKRTGTVKEETWDEVTQGCKTEVAIVNKKLEDQTILTRARTAIDNWNYAVTSKNCEHFVNWAANEKLTSKQVQLATVSFISGAALYTFLAKNPKVIWAVAAGVGLGVLAVYLVTPKSENI